MLAGIAVAVLVVLAVIGTQMQFNKALTMEQFRSKAIGKSKTELVNWLGQPDRANDSTLLGRRTEYWWYNDKAKSMDDGRLKRAQVIIESDRVTRVEFW